MRLAKDGCRHHNTGWKEVQCFYVAFILWGFPGGSDTKESACSAGDLGSIPGSGRSLGEGNGNRLQYSCLENPMDRGAWQATVHGVTESDMTERITSNTLTRSDAWKEAQKTSEDHQPSADRVLQAHWRH